MTQDGQTYSTTFDYSGSNLGDYHQPSTITEQGQLTRVTTRTYDYSFAPYLLNRVKSETVTVSGSSDSFTTSYEYEDATGFLDSQSTYGVTSTFLRDARGNREARHRRERQHHQLHR